MLVMSLPTDPYLAVPGSLSLDSLEVESLDANTGLVWTIPRHGPWFLDLSLQALHEASSVQACRLLSVFQDRLCPGIMHDFFHSIQIQVLFLLRHLPLKLVSCQPS